MKVKGEGGILPTIHYPLATSQRALVRRGRTLRFLGLLQLVAANLAVQR